MLLLLLSLALSVVMSLLSSLVRLRPSTEEAVEVDVDDLTETFLGNATQHFLSFSVARFDCHHHLRSELRTTDFHESMVAVNTFSLAGLTEVVVGAAHTFIANSHDRMHVTAITRHARMADLSRCYSRCGSRGSCS